MLNLNKYIKYLQNRNAYFASDSKDIIRITK